MELAEHAFESVILYDLTGSIRYCNVASAMLYGWRQAEALGRGFDSLQADSVCDAPSWASIVAAGGWSGTLRRRSDTGAEVMTSVRLVVRLDPSGRAQDVIEYSDRRPDDAASAVLGPDARRRNRTACWELDITGLALSHGEPGASMALSGDGLEALLAAVRVKDLNTEAMRLFGLPMDRDRLVALPLGGLWPERSHPVLAELILALAARTDDATERREISAAGWLDDVVLTGWRAGDPRCLGTIFVTISGKVNAAVALHELEARQDRYRNMLSAMPIPIFQVDAGAADRMLQRLLETDLKGDLGEMSAYVAKRPDFVEQIHQIVTVTDVNEQAMALMGATDKSQLLRPVQYFFATAPDAARRVLLAHCTEVNSHVEEIKIQTLDGRLQDVLFVVMFPGAGQRLDNTIVVMLDNTARLEAETKFRRLQDDFARAARLSTLGELTASIAHEVKQPISAMLTNAETSLRWLARDEPNLAKVTQLTERITESARRASDIINRIQDMAGKREPARVPLDLNDTVAQAVNFVRHDTDEKAIAVHLELASDLPPVLGDRVQLQQIVVNLLVNSVQALTPVIADRAAIWISTCLGDREAVVVTVRDTGPGIPDADLERVFDGFFTTKSEGMGIGLAICQSIASTHGGSIAAANHPEGGALFTITLPVMRDVRDFPCSALVNDALL
jgi:signal transduction histidine kinase